MRRLPVLQTIKRNAAFFSLLSFTVFMSYANFKLQKIDSSSDQSSQASRFTENTSSTSSLPQPPLFRSDGLIEANYDNRHPIYDLIENAKADWDAKLARQSKSLREACLEYKRRYNRDPPPGFDRWYVVPHTSTSPLISSRWAYVERHRVQLPDEYDFLHRNLEIFWGISPALLEQRRLQWAANSGTFTIGKNHPEGKVEITSIRAQQNGDIANVQWRAGLQYILLSIRFQEYSLSFSRMNVLKDIGKSLSPFNATFYSEDGNIPVIFRHFTHTFSVPYQFFSHEAKDLARRAAKSSLCTSPPSLAAL